MTIEQRIQGLPVQYKKILDELQSLNIVGCLHLIVEAGEEYKRVAELTEISDIPRIDDTIMREIYGENKRLNEQVRQLQALNAFQQKQFEEVRKFESSKPEVVTDAAPQSESGTQTEAEHFSETLFANVEKLESATQQHLVYLLLNQNYSLSNLLSQQYLTDSGLLKQITADMTVQDLKQTVTKQQTVIENLSDAVFGCQLIQETAKRFTSSLSIEPSAHDNDLAGQKLRFELEQAKTKVKIEQIAVSSEDFVKDKHAMAVVYWRSLCAYYERVINDSVTAHINYAKQQPQQNDQSTMYYQQRQNSDNLVGLLQQMWDEKNTYEQIKQQLNQISQLPPSKVILQKSEYQQDLKKILQQIIVGLCPNPQRTINEHQQQIKLAYLKSQNEILLEVVLRLSGCVESKNNSENLNRCLFEAHQLQNQLSLQNEDLTAKVVELKSVNESLQAAHSSILKRLQEKFAILQTSMDCQKLEKLESIITQQQKIINSQQGQLEMFSVQTLPAEVQTDIGYITQLEQKFDQTLKKLLDAQLYNKQLLQKYESQEAELGDSTSQMHKAQLKSSLTLAKVARELAAVDVDFSDERLREQALRMEVLSDKVAQLTPVVSKLMRVVQQQRQKIKQLSPETDFQNTQTEMSVLQCGNQFVQVETAAEARGVQIEQVFSCDPKQTQTEHECQECKKLLKMYIIERQQLEGNLEKIEQMGALEDRCKAKADKCDRLVQDLQQQENTAQQALKQILKLKKDIKELEQQTVSQNKKIEEVNADNIVLTDTVNSQKQVLKEKQYEIKKKQELLEIREQKISTLLKDHSEMQRNLTEQNRILKDEITKLKRITQDGEVAEENLKAQLQLHLDTIKKLKIKRNRVPLEDKKVMSSILSADDIDAIYDVQ